MYTVPHKRLQFQVCKAYKAYRAYKAYGVCHVPHRVSRKKNPQVLCFALPSSVVISNVATLSKMTAFCFTYPLETCKLYTQMGKSIHYKHMYQGFSVFLLTATLQCYINYNLLFSILQHLPYHLPKHLKIFGASFLSCLLTSVIKVPVTYVSRNIVFLKTPQNTNFVQHLQLILKDLTPNRFRKGWLTNMLSDVPDSFIKFFVNEHLILWYPFIDNFTRSCITGIITCITNTPFDILVTKTMCTATNDDNPKNDMLTGLPYRLFASIVGNTVFFTMFNTLMPAGIV